MKVTIGGNIYDTETATKLAHCPTHSNDQQLFQSPGGSFFLYTLQLYVDGKKLGPHETWVDLGPTKTKRSRLSMVSRITPFTDRQAIEWSIKSLIPAPFRGFLLESL